MKPFRLCILLLLVGCVSPMKPGRPSATASLHSKGGENTAGLKVAAKKEAGKMPAAQSRQQLERPWLGPEYWSNPLQDWRLRNGRIECISTGKNRNVHLLTRRLGSQKGDLTMSVRIGTLDGRPLKGTRGTAGFRIGIRSPLGDYRSSLIKGGGLNVGITTAGRLLIGNIAQTQTRATLADLKGNAVELRLKAEPSGDGYRIVLSAHNPATGAVLGRAVRDGIAAERLVGNLAIVSNYGPVQARRGQRTQGGGAAARFWFSDWKVSGSKVETHEDRKFGPILFAAHTLSRGVLKMTAQMPPIGANESQTVRLEIRTDGEWNTVGREQIDPLSRTATFRVEKWDASRNVPYRLVYALTDRSGRTRDHFWTGTVRRDPVNQETLVVAGFTGNTDAGFPNARLVENVGKIDPDVLVFTGDQLYESVGGYGIQRKPLEVATLDYLRKWYIFGWAFRDLMRDRPTLCLPDDHDVYQSNIWGEGGRPVSSMREHPRGGYVMNPVWVNAIQRMQTSHHPDPYDPTPIEQGITVYYGDMLYGGISFAVLEDRKFKSGPKGRVNTWQGRPDHITDPDFDPKSVDLPGLKLLGERQLKFLRDWAADWRGASMKIVCSQTIFANVANYHGFRQTYLVADLDANGWPQSGRNRALRELRRGFAFHLAGDQHLASIVHHGVDTWGDAIWSFCVPSIAAGYPRSWHPERKGKTGKNRKPGAPPYTGDFLDGLGNHISVNAVGNPASTLRKGVLDRLHDKASGFGIVRLNKKTRKITMECWRLMVDLDNPKPGDQFPGWPFTIDMEDNYARAARAHLPTLRVTGMTDPVVQVIDESNGEIVYTLRIRGRSYRPKVFKPGLYTVRVGDQDTGRMKKLSGLRAIKDNRETIEVRF